MFWLYFLAIIPICIGLFLKLTNHRVNWLEYGIGVFLALVTAVLFNCWAYFGQVGDYETWSGSIQQTRQYSEWKEYYEYAVYKTETYTTRVNGKSVTQTRRVFSHWQPTTRWHRAEWKMTSNIQTSYDISKEKFEDLSIKFGGYKQIEGDRKTGERHSKMIDGNPYDYLAINRTGYIEPVNKSVLFENRVKASNSIFKKRAISETEAKELFKYPYHNNNFTSDRLMGDASNFIDKNEWEKLNGYLGPFKYINVICIGFGEKSPDIFDKQIAYWQGGKKNDFIIGFGNNWARVYSWSDSEIAKSNVETLFLDPKNPELLQELKNIISKDYEKVEWGKKFQHLSVSPEIHHVLLYLLTLILTQAGLYSLFHKVEIEEIFIK